MYVHQQFLTILVEFFPSHLLPPTPAFAPPLLTVPSSPPTPQTCELSYALMFHSQQSVPLFLSYQLLVYSVQCQSPPAIVRKLCDKNRDVHSVHQCWREVLMEADHFELSTKHFHRCHARTARSSRRQHLPSRPAPSAVSLLRA